MQRIGRMESLRQELPRLFESVGQAVSREMREFIDRAEPRNATPHAHYAGYYDDESRELVAERDAPVIARHGFRLGD